MRAVARRRWFLHRTGQRVLFFGELKHLRGILAAHHSCDAQFHRRITAAMDSSRFRQKPWGRRFCKRLTKANATYCGQCGRHWTDALDGKYRHGQRQGSQRRVEGEWTYTQRQDAPWNSQNWNPGGHRNLQGIVLKHPRKGRKSRRGKNKNKKQGQGQPQVQVPEMEQQWTDCDFREFYISAEQKLHAMAAMKKNEASLPADLLHEDNKA